ncbi:MAG TPA: ATP-grasp domain-containing protein [Pirellulaceae bacterium]|jgi:predicted ATP-grasp superfamily ATP-dependent carboligase|nr:ATP-grasp domain-containing protein [Pirellulaceae bacterium]
MTAIRVFLYEFVTGGGCWSLSNPQPPGGTLLTEGTAMLQSLACDLLAVGNLELHVLADSRLAPFWPEGSWAHEVNGGSDERRLLLSLAESCDMTLVIAPEFDELLLSRCQWVASVGGTLLTPDGNFVALAANKQKLADCLHAAGLPVPRSVALRNDEPLPRNFPFPAVLKPVDGAGSLAVQLVRTATELREYRSSRQSWRLEMFQPGTAASVSVLCGPQQNLVLLPGQQLLTKDGQFNYLGGTWPLAVGDQERAAKLAARVALALPATCGYIGIDLVLGPNDDGSDDVVIEVNPRLTTSYVGLRQLARTNLAAAMLRVAEGLPVTVTWHDQALTYHVAEMPLGDHRCIG